MTLRVLVVEDNTADFHLIEICLQEALGDEVSTEHAASVEEAGALMDKNDYAVIFHDLFLPSWGAEAITTAHKKSPNTPIVAISGDSSPELHRMAIANGAKIYCAKAHIRSDNIISILAPVLPELKNR